MQRTIGRLRLHFMSYWHRLVAPLLRIEDEERMRFAMRLAIVLAGLVVTTAILAILLRYQVSQWVIIPDIMLLLVVLFSLLFMWNLRGWHQFVARITIATMEVTVFVIWLSNTDAPANLVLNYLILLLFISSRLLPLREIQIQAGLNIGSLLVLRYLFPDAQFLGESIIFNIVFSATVVLITASRQRDLLRTQKTEERYRNLMDANFEPVAILDLRGKILDINMAFEKLSGFTMKELRGRSIGSLLTPDSGTGIMANFGRIGTELLRANAINAQGEIIPIETHSRLSTYNDIPALTVIVRNLALQSTMEREKRDYELRYKAIFENTNDAVYILSLEGIYLASNPRGWEMIGITQDEIVGTKISEFVVDDEKAESVNVMQRLLNNEFIPNYVRKFRRKNGGIFYGDVFAMLVRDHEDKPLYVQSIVRDVTERKRAEENRLELAVQQERNSVLKQLIDDFSHHVRTPLANIKNSSYLMGRVEDTERRQKQGNIIDGEIERLVSLLDDLLTLASIDPESEKQTIVPLEITELVRSIVPSPIGGGVNDEAHVWSLHTTDAPITISGNRARLSDVFRRLMLNARHYTAEGGKIEVALTCHDDKKAVCIAIKDSGIGIAANDVEHIFETFYRSDNAREMNPLSSGLGLSICQKIVEIHRGVIHVTSTLGVGSRFEVWLPLELTTLLTYDSLGFSIAMDEGH